METFYIDKYTVEVEMNNAPIGGPVDAVIKMTDGGKIATAYRLTRFVDDTPESVARRAMLHYRMGDTPESCYHVNLIDAPKRGFVDESGCRRHTMTSSELNVLYRKLENFIADCTKDEYERRKDEFASVLTIIHQRMNSASDK